MTDDAEITAAINRGDHDTFAALAERHRRALHLHCYRMLGSFGDAEDLVQETLLRAWRSRAGFAGRARFSTWLYKIATNACLDALERAAAEGGPLRRVLPADVVPPVTADFDAADARSAPPWRPELPWIDPYPDQLLPADPETALATRETLGLAFVAALQQLPPQQRAVLILCDVLGWSAKEAAAALELTLAAVTSALQRAHATMRTPAQAAPPSDRERALLESFIAALESTSADALVQLLTEDARWAMPPAALWFDGRATIARLLALYPLSRQGAFAVRPTAANRQPAAAVYIRRPDQTAFHFAGVHVLRLAGDAIAEITTFSPALCARFGLPEKI